MFEFSDRQRQIIFFIFSKQFATASVIASLFSVSEKTIRNEIKIINSICDCKLIISNNNGYLIDKNHDYLISNIPLFNTEKNDYNKILSALLTHHSISIYDLCEALNLSETALENRMISSRKIFKSYNLTLLRKQNHYSLSGTSFNKRKIFIESILEKVGSNFYNINMFKDDFTNVDIAKTMDVLNITLKNNDVSINEFYLNNFALNLLTILNFDFDCDVKLEYPLDNKVYGIAKTLDSSLNRRSISKTLPIYSCLIGVIESPQKNMLKFKKEIEEITKTTFEKYSLDIDVSSFLNIFSQHIFDMITRCKHNNLIQIDGGISIKESNLFVYDIAVNLANELTKKYEIIINQNEISLISMHLGFAIENYLDKTIQNNRLNIALNTSQYLSSKTFIEKVKNIIPDDAEINFFQQLETINDINDNDLYITSNNFRLPISIPTCIVSPILTNEDKLKIKSMIHFVVHKKKIQHSKTLFNMFLMENLFFVNEQLNTKDVVLDFLFEHLKEQDIVNNSFCSSVLVREALTPTCINNKYAVPHAMEFIAKRTNICVFINPNGIQWDDQTVKIVFLSAINKNNIINLRIIYDFIIDMVSDDTAFSKLIQAKDIHVFYDILFAEHK
ncbi:MAG: BglG family transcription antiterminator [Breznakia sp.]